MAPREPSTVDAPATTDEVWRQRLTSGDESALGDLYDLYGQRVYGLALRMTRSREAAEDVTQEVFSYLWERPLAFDPGKGTLYTWLGLLAHRRAVEVVRTEERRRRILRATHEPPPPDRGVEDEVTEAEVSGRVQRAVAALPGTLREVIELAYFKGRTYRQVATDLGLAEGTAKSRIRSALRHIADTLDKEGITP